MSPVESVLKTCWISCIAYSLFGELRNTSGHITYYGPEFTAKAVREWLSRVNVRTLFIEPGSPWENGYVESFNKKMRDELLNGEIFDTLLEARVVIENWRRAYNPIRPPLFFELPSAGSRGFGT